ncbi:class II histocompatibility antigen, M beta 1 chain [Ascaphus truei]|uniref:class II histocompatibility antigen, M beta 1 chain n=1 Tax=Ascaphus truei TaxID=8439 RepID=UPI003F59A82F
MRGSPALPLVPLLYWTLCSPGTGFVMQQNSGCSFGGQPGGNVTFFYALTFNHQLVVAYDRTEEMFVPCGHCIAQMYKVAANISSQLNAIPGIVQRMRESGRKCAGEAQEYWGGTVGRRVPPSMRVYLSERRQENDRPLLVCHVWGFYPRDIVVSWVKNEKIQEATNSSAALPAGDWTYRVVTLLDVTDARSEDLYECVVRHSSQESLMRQEWRLGLTTPQRIKIGVSVAVLAVGLLSLLTGFICWKKAKRSGYSPIPGYSEAN